MVVKVNHTLSDVPRVNLSHQKHVLSILFMGVFIMFLTFFMVCFAAILGGPKF